MSERIGRQRCSCCGADWGSGCVIGPPCKCLALPLCKDCGRCSDHCACRAKIRATRTFYILPQTWHCNTAEKLQSILKKELDIRGRSQWDLDPKPYGNRVKITVTAEFIPEKKEEGIE